MASLGMDGLTAFEDGVIELGEELGVERFDGTANVGFGDDEADVEERRALGDHADIDAVERVEHSSGYSGSASNVVADQADDHLAAFDLDVGELAQLGGDFVQ